MELTLRRGDEEFPQVAGCDSNQAPPRFKNEVDDGQLL
jgi:hypothetical protein